MAIDELPPVTKPSRTVAVADASELESFVRRTWPKVARVLQPLASLKLTVVLLALSIFIVLAGTFAQTRLDIWDAIIGYFRIDHQALFSSSFPYVHVSELFVWVDAQLFFPPSFFPNSPSFPPGLGWLASVWPTQDAVQSIPSWVGIWFPRGWTIGVVMIANLLAAHLLRFKLQTTGTRLYAGLGVLAAGLLLTYFIILGGSEGVQGGPWVDYRAVWMLLDFSFFLAAAPCVYYALNLPAEKRGAKLLLATLAVLCCGIGVTLGVIGPVAPEGMRILYQLLQGSIAAGVLLAGCLLLFRKRAGIVLLHGGVGLLMFYEVLVGVSHVEMQMIIPEGETTNFAFDSRTTELAFVDRSSPFEERHIVIENSRLQPGEMIQDDQLPVDVEVVSYYRNATFRPVQGDEKADATQGFGSGRKLLELPRSKGTESQQDFPGAIVRLWSKPQGDAKPRDLGTWLLSTQLDETVSSMPPRETISVAATQGAGPRDFEVSLRFERHYKPYSIKLIDVQKNDYAGTNHARDWRSVIDLTSGDGGKVLDHYQIWMNNPLKFGTETFYQQNWAQLRDGTEVTTLQVVQNEGWMAPYVACMIVAVGMMFQFGLGLSRFVGKQSRTSIAPQVGQATQDGAREAAPAAAAGDESLTQPLGAQPSGAERPWWAGWGAAVTIAALALLMLGSPVSRARKQLVDEYDFAAFGSIPVIMGGRSLPLDSIAMNRLMQLSDRQSFKERDQDPSDDEVPAAQPATKWLLDMITREEVADTYPVFRIEDDQTARAFGLEVHPTRAYSLSEFEDKLEAVVKRLSEDKTPPKDRSPEDRKQFNLVQQVMQYRELQGWFFDFEPGLRQRNPELFAEKTVTRAKVAIIGRLAETLHELEVKAKADGEPLMIPLHIGEAEGSFSRHKEVDLDWEPFSVATGYKVIDDMMGRSAPPAVDKFRAILTAYRDQKPQEFNAAVAEYKAFLHTATDDQLKVSTTQIDFGKSNFEAYFNRLGPFNLLSFAYVFVLLLAIGGWVARGFRADNVERLLQRSAFLTAAGLLVLHTLAIGGRIYISGRPPVTNLYSSAIFIGWAMVLMGVIFEGVFKMGIGNAVAALTGFATLRIAHALMTDGDTMAVLEPVLDTQFWLATHVVCISLGYAATYVAGVFGLMYILRGSRIGLFVLGVFSITASGLALMQGDLLGISAGTIAALAGITSILFGVLRRSQENAEFDMALQKNLSQLMYGTICGATLLSFVGTVLGGLWADDSWGRFWGWDPKENGALIIVLWNALILHARWDRMIGHRGMAALSVLGNVVVSWSWFGVNELGIGKHTYGFTEGRLFWLLMFGLSQVAVAALVLLPRSLWWGERRTA
ncbi:MAG: cytochrome c biogenesis protein CcsA [Planctomycetaceae bacterium]